MSLHEVYEITKYDVPVFWERVTEDCSYVGEYDPKDQFKLGASKVYHIKPEQLPEIGNVIMCSI